MMRRAHVGWVVGTLVACASPGMPPGGPPDDDVPVVVRISPDSNALNVRARAVLIHFDEVISERPGRASTTGPAAAPSGLSATSGGAADLSSIVSISPSDGRERVQWRRTAIEIEPRQGFRPNTTYRVTVLPGVADLRGNVIAAPLTYTFSTGSAIPHGEVRGVVFDWAQGGPASGARVEVFLPTDSGFRWSARADSLGRFVVRDLASGSYGVRAWIDGDSDRRVGLREAFDTTTIALDTAATTELYAYVRDTLAPRVEAVNAIDSLTLGVRFDRVVAAAWDPSGKVAIVGADSVARPVTSFIPRARLDSLRRATSPDTTAADTTGVPVDTARAAAPADTVAPPDTAAAPDTSVTRPQFGRPLPVQQWAIQLDAPLPPGLYRLRVTAVHGLNGISRATDREFRIAEPVVRPDPDSPTPPTTPPTPVPTDTALRRP